MKSKSYKQRARLSGFPVGQRSHHVEAPALSLKRRISYRELPLLSGILLITISGQPFIAVLKRRHSFSSAHILQSLFVRTLVIAGIIFLVLVCALSYPLKIVSAMVCTAARRRLLALKQRALNFYFAKNEAAEIVARWPTRIRITIQQLSQGRSLLRFASTLLH